MAEQAQLSGPDLSAGVDASTIAAGGKLLGHANGEAVLLARVGDEFLAIGATCTHYSGPLADGLVDGDTVRCPWHHACFDLRTGEAVQAPALNPLACWNVVRQGERVRVADKRAPAPVPPSVANEPRRIVIVGAGAAGHAC